MVSSGQKGGDLLFFTSETPHFFKIILEDTVREGKLVIPRNFMKNYGGFLGNLVFLRVPSGAVWQVELARENANACLHKGWNEFAEYYSLACGHFLVFELKVRSEFQVLIFDKSATEIKYPYYNTVSSEEPVLDGQLKGLVIERYMDDDSTEILDDFTIGWRYRERSPLKTPQPHKKKRNEPTSAIGRDSASNSRKNVAQCSGSKAGTCTFSGENIGSGRAISTGRRRMRTLTSEEKAQAFQRASAFKSQHPYFMTAMQPRCVHKYELGIPIDFARNHLGLEHSEVILCGPDGRTWPVEYHCYPHLSRPKAAIGNGWKEFVLGNSLKFGDVCVFELMRTCGLRLNVFIF